MAMVGIQPKRWGKVANDGSGIRIPKRCPSCRSRRTMLTTYKNGAKAVECEGCYTVIQDLEINKQ